ncbi:Protein of unknown function [Pyronema omphalodes CBS 100304]|uniref:Uncharacterized protein n=1 Tax=Pyronema omphalodes (strain CBS 100304) TaxID=1076935 RepID=U4LLC5_PYROM|nr:Protein of unknown function [Pyronema omphalodes CBS 100304]
MILIPSGWGIHGCRSQLALRNTDRRPLTYTHHIPGSIAYVQADVQEHRNIGIYPLDPVSLSKDTNILGSGFSSSTTVEDCQWTGKDWQGLAMD